MKHFMKISFYNNNRHSDRTDKHEERHEHSTLNSIEEIFQNKLNCSILNNNRKIPLFHAHISDQTLSMTFKNGHDTLVTE